MSNLHRLRREIHISFNSLIELIAQADAGVALCVTAYPWPPQLVIPSLIQGLLDQRPVSLAGQRIGFHLQIFADGKDYCEKSPPTAGVRAISTACPSLRFGQTQPLCSLIQTPGALFEVSFAKSGPLRFIWVPLGMRMGSVGVALLKSGHGFMSDTSLAHCDGSTVGLQLLKSNRKR